MLHLLSALAMMLYVSSSLHKTKSNKGSRVRKFDCLWKAARLKRTLLALFKKEGLVKKSLIHQDISTSVGEN